MGNLNDDDCVDGLDYIIWSGNYDLGSPSAGQVPEPATVSLLALAGLALLRRRRNPERH